MKKYLTVVLSIVLSGCTKYQPPYLIPNVALQGNHWLKGDIIQSTKKRYWLSYEQALLAEEYVSQYGEGELYNKTTIKIPGNFKTYDYKPKNQESLSKRQEINRRFFEEGYVYASSICTGYFQQANYTKSQRDFARSESNIAAGLISAALGLADVSVKAVSGVGVGFSALNSSFDAYNNSFLVSPQLGLLEQVVKQKMENIYIEESKNNFNSVGQVINSLSKVSIQCSQTGMQVIVDEVVNDKLKKSTLSEPDLAQTLKLKLKEAEAIAQAIEASEAKKIIEDNKIDTSDASAPVRTK